METGTLLDAIQMSSRLVRQARGPFLPEANELENLIVVAELVFVFHCVFE